MVSNLHTVLESVRKRAEEVASRRLVRLLKSVGEQCVDEAVSSGNYTDRTGNLRSSIGFVVAKDGQVVEEGGFRPLGGPDGPDIGRAKALGLAEGSQGVVLFVVAGMSYASLVADKGFNVLDSAEILARSLLTEIAQ